MSKLISILLLSVLLIPGLVFVPSVAIAAPFATYEFDTSEQERLFHKIIEEIRCVVCQNQNISESNAQLAQDLRNKVYTMLKEGRSETEITDFMVQRYGDFVLYRPPFEPKTWLLWFGPGIAFILFIVFAVRFMRAQSEKPPVERLSDNDLEHINKLHEQSGEQK